MVYIYRILLVWLQLICKIFYSVSETYRSPSDILRMFLKQIVFLLLCLQICCTSWLHKMLKLDYWNSLSWMVLNTLLRITYCLFVLFLFLMKLLNYIHFFIPNFSLSLLQDNLLTMSLALCVGFVMRLQYCLKAQP